MKKFVHSKFNNCFDKLQKRGKKTQNIKKPEATLTNKFNPIAFS